jgi:hypothetical protein
MTHAPLRTNPENAQRVSDLVSVMRANIRQSELPAVDIVSAVSMLNAVLLASAWESDIDRTDLAEDIMNASLKWARQLVHTREMGSGT